MRAVDNDRHALVREDLKARGMAHTAQRCTHSLLRHTRVLALEQLCRHDDECGVLRLIDARESEFKRLGLAADNGVKSDTLPASIWKEELA